MSAEWIFDALPASKARKGGIAADQVFDANIDTFVREVLQNCLDQRLDGSDLPVEVNFSLTELSGPEMKDLLEAAGWDVLSQHLEDSERQGGSTIAGRLQEGLELIEQGTIRAMVIEDRNTNGLSGGEDETDSNFANLCRHELVSSSERTESGGSFGIGKSVLWRFSTLSSVIFSSRPEDRDTLRFIGRTYLPSHDAEGEAWEGPGWFGEREQTGPLPRAISMEGSEAEEAAEACLIGRQEGDKGTSILVLGFDDPHHDDEPSVAETCESIIESANRWFWPAIAAGSLSVSVNGHEGGEEVFKDQASASVSEIEPFVQALENPASDTNDLDEPGDVIERSISVLIPSKRDEGFSRVEASAQLRVRLADADDGEEFVNRVALQRGTGMVVSYYEPKQNNSGGPGIHAVLLAGLANGETDSDHALEEFLRAAEPPAHNEWTPFTERLKAEYVQSGRRKAVYDLFSQIDQAVLGLLDEVVADTDEVPDFLRKLLPLKGTGRKQPSQKFSLKSPRAYLVDDHWQFEGSYVKKDSSAETWWFKLVADIDQEGSGKKTVIPIAQLKAPGCESLPLGDDGAYLVEVTAGLAEIPFSGMTEAVPVADPQRVQIRLNLSPCDQNGNPA